VIICETEFEREDPDHLGYSMLEVDYYAWIPAGSPMPCHRLSLRKNLRTGEYEVYRRYFQRRLNSRDGVTLIIGNDLGREEVAFKSMSLEEAVEFASEEWRRSHGEGRSPDKVCQHRPPDLLPTCKIWEKMPAEERMKALRGKEGE